MSQLAIQSLRGMPDWLPPIADERQILCSRIRAVLAQFGYQAAELPLLEKTQLFKRTIGDETDVVSKEMYSFDDRNRESVTLRPEGTAGVVRAMIQNGLLQQNMRLFIEGPMFRYEKPQEGRYRQFSQISVESFGIATPAMDVELILLAHEVFTQLGIRNAVTLEINTIGLSSERIAFQKALVTHLEQHINELDEDSKRRLSINPLRILDSKDENTRRCLDTAPVLKAYLGEQSQQHFSEVCALLDALEIKYIINPRLVRGLDYYCHTVIEWTTQELGAQGTICAGGRYDGLVEQLGGKSTPAAGFAFGIERILLLAQKFGAFKPIKTDLYLLAVTPKEQAVAMQWAMALRRNNPNLRIVHHNEYQSLKKQFRKADLSGAQWVLVFGSDEVAHQEVTVKNLKNGEQERLTLAQLLAKFAKKEAAEKESKE
ncbi:histidine--tRNA ligase [Suttonella ornithocola]|uniref:Histidine--tRNA ligase n=1 Tax=Suttonella ornithocola TaxID=279832 RepID=A0A380MVY2_9GAMM|nr:histidine--tRNA ligase [Suttonella ornithocola]SUO95871.1 Histidine--tRNA ligase [Suttonella ornithocola]